MGAIPGTEFTSPVIMIPRIPVDALAKPLIALKATALYKGTENLK